VPETFKAIPVTDSIYWVGAIDWTVRDFHGYSTSRGSTYNAFLILGDKVTLVDTVKAPFMDQLVSRIASVIDPETIDVIVSNHAEMDHSGCLEKMIRLVKPETVYVSANGAKAIEAHFHGGLDLTVVKDGQSVDLGGKTLTFVETRMCHWPDSMVSYVHEDELLFSQDAFGMHLASSQRWADEIDPGVLDYEAAKYYANILMPLGTFINKALSRWQELNLPLTILAPDHGPLYRQPEQIDWIIGQYARWASLPAGNKAVVVYDTMWQSTAKMAHAISEGLIEGGATVEVMPLSGCHRSDVATQVLEAGAVLVGSPTINQQMFPTVADVMSYLRGLKPKGKLAAAFGSFGWGGEAPKLLHADLEAMGLEMVADEPLRVKYVPETEALDQCRQLGMMVAEQLRARAEAQ
jgi:flavorubredoxin